MKINWWSCVEGSKCGTAVDECVQNVEVSHHNVQIKVSGTCGSQDAYMGENECEAYAKMVGLPFEFRSKSKYHAGCSSVTVPWNGEDVAMVIYNRYMDPMAFADCSAESPCVCLKPGSDSSDSDEMVELELADASLIEKTKRNFWMYLFCFGAFALLGAWHSTSTKKNR